MKNRYDNLLRKYNKDILDLVPYKPFLFVITAKEIEKVYREGDKILEIGTGEGDSALPILKHTKGDIDLLDVSKEMLDIAKENLKEFSQRTHYICEDANDYLKKSGAYNIIFSAWTIHNFNNEDKKVLLNSIFANLSQGGHLFIMDKVYPVAGGLELLKKQNERFERYLPEEVAAEIVAHEKEDSSDEYRLDEESFLKSLKEIGFSSVEIIDRVERDVVIIAKK